MKTIVVALLAGCVIANGAFAIVDPDDISMGIYFDANADVFEISSAPYVMVSAHIILTNPTFPVLYGYEFGYTIYGNHMVSGTNLWGTGPFDVGGGPGNHIVGLAAPLATNTATKLCTLTLFILDANPIALTLAGSIPNDVPGSNLPAVSLAGDGILPIGLSAGLDGAGNPMVSAYINGFGVVASEQASWGQVKSLYR